jgi:putative FmdB family regulatory protein
MPTYEYVCKSCGHLFEIVQSMKDDPLTECPQCGGELRKVFTAPAIAFKGSGFYATDARRAASGAKGKDAKPSSGGESDTKTTEKPSEKKREKKSDTTTGSSSTKGAGSSD